MKQLAQEGEIDNLENLKMKNKIKEMEEKINGSLSLNNLKGKQDIKPIKEEINNLIELDHECNKRARLEPHKFEFEIGERRVHASTSQVANTK